MELLAQLSLASIALPSSVPKVQLRTPCVAIQEGITLSVRPLRWARTLLPLRLTLLVVGVELPEVP